jgi:hypothetical protein
VTARFAPRNEAEALAKRIKATITKEVGPLPRGSIGVAPNWLLAKVASDRQKPDGLVILDEADLSAKLLPLAPGDVVGIGPNIQLRLTERGATAMAQPYSATKDEFRSIWKSVRREQIWPMLHSEVLLFFEQKKGQTVTCCPPTKRNREDALPERRSRSAPLAAIRTQCKVNMPSPPHPRQSAVSPVLGASPSQNSLDRISSGNRAATYPLHALTKPANTRVTGRGPGVRPPEVRGRMWHPCLRLRFSRSMIPSFHRRPAHCYEDQIRDIRFLS